MPIYALNDQLPQLPEAGRFWVAPAAHVIGRVHLGIDVGIWFGAVVRGDKEIIEIGARSNIQDNAVLHSDPGFPLVIGEDVTVGHAAIVHGCSIGAGTLIGMGATVLNGARIGSGCLVGANALIPEGKVFPDGSLIVGAPAVIVRPLDGKTIERLVDTARRYVENWRHFATGLRQLE
jgi:carbonic anhydrase/acetyltransferase-like protein (isoleucine patch superfamily)